MWYWKTDFAKSRIFFDWSGDAVTDLEKHCWVKNAQIIEIPENGSKHLVINLRLVIGTDNKGQCYVPDVARFPQERHEHELTKVFNKVADQFASYNELGPDAFPTRADLWKGQK